LPGDGASGLVSARLIDENGHVKQVETLPDKKSLRYTLDHGADGTLRVVLAGAIDENADLVTLFGRVTGATVMNMRDVERVNSIGVHGWVPLINRASAKHKVAVEELSYALVQSANAVANMFGTATLRSCMAPYFCARCNRNVIIAVTAEEAAGAAGGAPAKQCNRCHAQLEFDELDGYFTFFKRVRK
jgi:hypothetical protein